ncbi:SusC/RagA family TonB-linked outer membrane protein [Echinicola strongylocentroti]|uniref:SusC/RagA family TonB-linked outer membrane protein n=1 Tax=Echinicola strongylocentroti TaxID=1795355 RepID=A0A2Z4IQ23_9BACT|nr:TonB-dependent receptor [Echinicola strongylocentroti]AWW32738.1 SusC/RagA family TonB-linked outer membrane protein [Echinicola strongylocentroti]
MKKLYFVILFFVMMTVCSLQAQTKSVSGKITDGTGETMPGVNIIEKGTSNGTTSDIDGNYTLSISDGAILVYSFIGYTPIERVVGTSTVIDITMESEMSDLSEVVVVGYGKQRKSDLTGAVGSASAKDLQERPTSSLPQALSGKIAGADVSQNSGRPGGKTQIRIRGNTSVSLNNSPLIVVDGVILASSTLGNNSNPIDYINSNDIASVEVLKDASATAIYGSRGANGVILVTTKRGSKNGGRVNYDSYYSLGKIAKKVDVLNSEQFLMIEDVAYQNAEKFDPVGWANGKYQDPALKRTDPLLFDADGQPIYDTDWQDEVTQLAFSQNHQLSFTGGNEDGSFGAFLGYTGEEGIMKESWMKRYSGRFVFDTNIKKWLKVGGSLSYNNQQERIIHNSWVGRNMIENIPIVPVKYPDGTWASNLDYPGMEGGPNPVRVGQEYQNYLRTQTVIGDVFVNIDFTEGLELRSSIGVNSIGQKTEEYAGRELNFIGTPTNGYASISPNQMFSWQFENYLTYNKKFAEIHSFTGLLGISWQHTESSNLYTRVNNFSDDFFSFNNLSAGSVPVLPTSSAFEEGINSYFGRINYGLKDKYLFTVTGRIDGSSKFGANNRYAFFPSAALAWRVSEEDFLIGSSVISNLKVRTSYGETGNSGIPAYGALAGLGTSSYVFNQSVVTGIGKGNLANPDLKWERTKQIDAGIELGLFSGRVSLEADVYKKVTTDMLLNAPVPQSSGYATVFRNIGSMENKGLEISLNTVNIDKGDFTWETMFNISMNRNEVTGLSGGSDIFPGGGKTIIREGESVNSFWGWVHLGTWGTDEEDVAASYNWLPGDIKLKDINEDGAINDADKVIIGNGLPKGYGSFINSIYYNNFEFSLDLQFTYGNDIMYITTRPQENRQGIANSLSTVLDAWTPENQDTEIAQWRPVGAGYDNRDTDHMIQDGSFIRGRNLLLAYNFTSDILDKMSLQKLRIYTSLQNFFLITKYQGYDPEVQTSNAAFGQGEVNFNQYPRPRVFMVGLNVSF